MDILLFAIGAGAIGLMCHWIPWRFAKPGGFARLFLVSAMLSLVSGGCVLLLNYIQLGDLPEPPGIPLFLAAIAFPISLFVGIPFLMPRTKAGRCNR
jgi:hypothetical protein